MIGYIVYKNLQAMQSKPEKTMRIGKEIDEECPTYFIADIATNHDGDIIEQSLIFQTAEANRTAKFQHFNANTIVSDQS